MNAVSWWDAVDDVPFINHGGLFRADGTPKPSLLRLESLISGWTSDGEITTGEDGTAVIQGFAGDYRIAIDLGGEVHERRTHISQGSTTILIIDLRPRLAPRRATGRVP